MPGEGDRVHYSYRGTSPGPCLLQSFQTEEGLEGSIPIKSKMPRLLAVRPSHVGVLDEGGVQDLIERSCEGEGYSANA